MAYGPSATQFSASGFTVGAAIGATAIAGALVAGAAAARASNWTRWTRDALVAGIEYSEAMRQRLFDQLQRANRMISDQRREIIELRAELRVARAQARGR
jgi:hypothetical protein